MSVTYFIPQRTHQYTGEVSRWASNRQPYIFRFIRQDAPFTTINNKGGFVEVTSLEPGFSTGNPVNYLPQAALVGTVLTLVNQNGEARSGKITVLNQWDASAKRLLTDIPWGTWSPNWVAGGYLIFEAVLSYRIRLTLTGQHPRLGEVVLGTAVGTPDSVGNLDMDVRELLTYGIDKLNRNTYLALNELDTSNWLSFTGTFSDTFYADRVRSTVTDEVVQDQPNEAAKFYAIDGVRYLLDLYGQNFAEYLVPQAAAYPARWLTAFPEPTRFVGYPWSASAIINQDAGRENINLVVDAAALGTLDNTLGTGVYFVNPSDTPTTATSTMYLENFGTSGNFALVPGYVTPGYTLDVNPVPVSPFQVTETLTLRNNLDCHAYPVYLCWRNSLGGWDYWLFDKKHEVAYTASQGTAFEVYVPDLQASGLRSKITQANQLKALTLGDLVDEITLTGLAEIERSPQVYMLWDDDQLSGVYPERAWLGVRIAPKGFKYFTNAGTIEVELTIVLPELYTVRN